MQIERRARSVSPILTPRDSPTSLSPYQRSATRPLVSSNRDDPYKTKVADEEMNSYTQTLQVIRRKLIETQDEVKNAREMSERAKSELMALEFRRGNASQEMERLSSEIMRKKDQMSALDGELLVKVEEVENMKSLGVTREDCLEIKSIKDENLLMKSNLRNMEGLHLERDELVRQLETSKEDLFREQKAARDKFDEMQEEMETIAAKLEEAETKWRTDQAQIGRLEMSYKRLEREKNALIQEKTQEYEELKSTLKGESLESENRLKKDLGDLNQEVRELRTKINDLQVENIVKEALADKLRSEMNEIGSLLDKERQDRHQESLKHQKMLQHLKKEMTTAVLKLKDTMFLEKQKALDDMKKELEEEKKDILTRGEEKLLHVLEEHSYHMDEKDAHIARMEDAMRRLESYSQVEMEEQVQEAVNRERERAELQKDWQLRQDKDEENRRVNEMIAVIDKEKQTNKELLTELNNLRKEVEQQRKQYREINKEKLVAVAKAKEQMKEQGNAEIERIKFNLNQEHESQIDKLNEKLHIQDLELTRMRSEVENLTERERHVLKILEQTERTIVTEIQQECHRMSGMTGVQQECHRMSGMTGVQQRTLHPASTHLEQAEVGSIPALKTRPAISSALTSLRSVIDDVQYRLTEMVHEQESMREMMNTVTKEKEESINSCKLEMDRKRISDLEKLKEKLLKEHVSEMSNVIKECAEANTQLKTNSQILQRYGDAALLEALQAKDDELHTMQISLNKWQGELEGKFNTQLQLQVAKEREKYQALQHHSTREQKRINDLQKTEIDRLENEIQRLASSSPHDSNRYVTSSPSPLHKSVPTTPVSSVLPPTASSLSLKSSQQYLQNRIEQLQAENAGLRKQRMLNSRQLSWSTSNLDKPRPPRSLSSLGRVTSPSRDIEGMQLLGERLRYGEQDIRKAEDRVKVHQKVMNNKMEEMMKLQSTLSIQNQELQDLERSYNDLQKHYHSRPGSPTRNLNTTN